MKSNFAKLLKLEKMIDEILNPSEEISVIVNISAGETKEAKIAEYEKESGKEVNKEKSIFLIVSGLSRI
jgi:hypothetical protein